MPDPAVSVEDPVEEVRSWLAGHHVGSIHPKSVEVVRDVDSSGDDAWYFEIVLANPHEGSSGWDATDIDDLQREVRDKALEFGLRWPWYLRFRPESDVEPEEPEHELAD